VEHCPGFDDAVCIGSAKGDDRLRRSVCTNVVYKAGRLDVSNCSPYGRQAEMSFIECCSVSFVRPHITVVQSSMEEFLRS
jgi:hypothetical protein